MTITPIHPPLSPLFVAAMQMLNDEPDHLARLCLLRDAFPTATLAQIRLALLETAIQFAYEGVQQ